jgi:hypothetical protein
VRGSEALDDCELRIDLPTHHVSLRTELFDVFVAQLHEHWCSHLLHSHLSSSEGRFENFSETSLANLPFEHNVSIVHEDISQDEVLLDGLDVGSIFTRLIGTPSQQTSTKFLKYSRFLSSVEIIVSQCDETNEDEKDCPSNEEIS